MPKPILSGLTISVTQSDIDKGRKGFVQSCAIARSLRRIAGVTRVEVDDYDIKVRKKGMPAGANCVFKTPAKAAVFINKFDIDKKSVKPFKFKLPKGKIERDD